MDHIILFTGASSGFGALAAHGGLDVLIHNAGPFAHSGRPADIEREGLCAGCVCQLRA